MRTNAVAFWRERMRNPHFVYFFTLEQFVKIGVSRDPRRRRVCIATSVPFSVSIAAVRPFESANDARKAEREYHERFASLRVRGEWFKRHVELELEIEKWRNHYEKAKNGPVFDRLYKLSEVAQAVALPLRTVQRDVEKGVVSVRRVGPHKQPRITADELANYRRILRNSGSRPEQDSRISPHC